MIYSSYQYHEEVKRSITATPYYKDLDIKEVRFKNEFNFNKFIIQPLWNVFNKTLNDGVEHCVKNVEANVAEWEKLLNEVLESKKLGEENKQIEEENEEEDNETASASENDEKEDPKKKRLETIEAEEEDEEDLEALKQTNLEKKT